MTRFVIYQNGGLCFYAMFLIGCGNFFDSNNECLTEGLQATRRTDSTTIVYMKYLNEDFSINEEKQKNCDSSDTYQLTNASPYGCFSTQLVMSYDAYTAEVEIYDSFGKKVHSSIQRFGYCGELLDDRRFTPRGMPSFLIWNLKDEHGRRVPSGVYTWEVLFSQNGEGSKIKSVYKSGLVCLDNSFNCNLTPG